MTKVQAYSTYLLRSNNTFPILEKTGKRWSGSGCQKALREHQTERGGIQRPGQSCHLWGYHNYPWVWAQTQVNTSLDATSMPTITTLAPIVRLEHSVERRSRKQSKVVLERSQKVILENTKEEPGYYSERVGSVEVQGWGGTDKPGSASLSSSPLFLFSLYYTFNINCFCTGS